MTVLAFHVFKQEKVDVAILEVGVGGAYDSTNIINQPVVCGVAALGIDHVSVLGSTLGEIAWNKGGIFKNNVPAVSSEQPTEGLDVLQSRAKEIGVGIIALLILMECSCDGAIRRAKLLNSAVHDPLFSSYRHLFKSFLHSHRRHWARQR